MAVAGVVDGAQDDGVVGRVHDACESGQDLSDAVDHGADRGSGSGGVAVGAEQVVAADGQGHHGRAEAGCLEPGELGVEQGSGGAAVDGEQVVAQRRVPGGQVVAAPVREVVVAVAGKQAGRAAPGAAGVVVDGDRVAEGDVDGIAPAEGHDRVYPCWRVQSRVSRSSGVDVLVTCWPVGADNSATPCDLLILVEQAPEPVPSPDAVRLAGGALGKWM